jgi:hypothetical protein
VSCKYSHQLSGVEGMWCAWMFTYIPVGIKFPNFILIGTVVLVYCNDTLMVRW